ncbi:MAG: alpha-1,2-fucosyltransferase [Candidatus Saccharimonadales bacterium]
MVIVKLYGGLGNQMFQYAAGLALSKRLQVALYPDLAWFTEIKSRADIVQRTYELDGFGIKPKKVSLIDRFRAKSNPPQIYKETTGAYRPDFQTLTGNILLDGYWQSHRYFENYRSEVINAFKFPKKISTANALLLKHIATTQSVSVHVRRGDYNTKVGQSYHGLLPKEYYKESINQLVESVDRPELFVFSDDIQWCKDHLKFKLTTTFIDSNSPNNGVEDMRLMSACRHNIIANSSFSWWGAWLNQNPDKIVYAPRAWFRKKDGSLDDRLPPDWIRL